MQSFETHEINAKIPQIAKETPFLFDIMEVTSSHANKKGCVLQYSRLHLLT
ncbi:hypothetical protein [Brevibacillus laterosporus]|uniref:hypothetical protein n=1 Tax=Brevibacillus laterosporus TaxID=1465 RepID=UPI00265CB5E4|nr:hypothetical protein [Brevibacillus laterosporus]